MLVATRKTRDAPRARLRACPSLAAGRVTGSPISSAYVSTYPAVSRRYWTAPLPDATDAAVTTWLESVIGHSKDGALQALSTEGAPAPELLYAYSMRMAELAVQRNDHDAVRHGLAALALASHVFDPRELVVIATLHHRSAEVIGLQIGPLLSSIEELATLEFAAWLREFPAATREHRLASRLLYRETRRRCDAPVRPSLR